jgi:hypothetical protein
MLAWEQQREKEILGTKKATRVVGTWKTLAVKEIHRKEVDILTTKLETVRWSRVHGCMGACGGVVVGCEELCSCTFPSRTPTPPHFFLIPPPVSVGNNSSTPLPPRPTCLHVSTTHTHTVLSKPRPSIC